MDIQDRTRLSVILLEECNFDCPHCLRVDEPMEVGYRLAHRELRSALDDCRALESVTWVHFTGGEPTLWTEGDYDLVDLLLEVASAGLVPSFTTNGGSFEDAEKCRDFLTRYFNATGERLILYVSVDTFHDNFDSATGRARCLDHVVETRRALPAEQQDRLDVRLVATISKSEKSLLPAAMIQHYTSLGVKVFFGPLRHTGRAKAIRHLCPDPHDTTQEGMGAYYPYRPRPTEAKPATSAREAGEAATSLVLVGSTYYLHFRAAIFDENDRWLEVGMLGDLPEAIVRSYAAPPS